MSIILAIDCSLKKTGVAVCSFENESVLKVLAHEQQVLGRNQSYELPFMTERIIHESGLSFNEINYVTVTKGPGYFTGIRVGASYASGIAYALGVKIIPVSTLDVLSRSFLCNDEFLTLVYAGHGFVYASSKNLDEGEYSHEQIYSWLSENKNVKKIISDDKDKLNMNLEIENVNPDIISLCKIASEKLNVAVEATELKISYYRAPQGVNF